VRSCSLLTCRGRGEHTGRGVSWGRPMQIGPAVSQGYLYYVPRLSVNRLRPLDTAAAHDRCLYC
jgi:hypothetical protein